MNKNRYLCSLTFVDNFGNPIQLSAYKSINIKYFYFEDNVWTPDTDYNIDKTLNVIWVRLPKENYNSKFLINIGVGVEQVYTSGVQDVQWAKLPNPNTYTLTLVGVLTDNAEGFAPRVIDGFWYEYSKEYGGLYNTGIKAEATCTVEGTVEVVDDVQRQDMRPVTSNAVYKAFTNLDSRLEAYMERTDDNDIRIWELSSDIDDLKTKNYSVKLNNVVYQADDDGLIDVGEVGNDALTPDNNIMVDRLTEINNTIIPAGSTYYVNSDGTYKITSLSSPHDFIEVSSEQLNKDKWIKIANITGQSEVVVKYNIYNSTYEGVIYIEKNGYNFRGKTTSSYIAGLIKVYQKGLSAWLVTKGNSKVSTSIILDSDGGLTSSGAEMSAQDAADESKFKDIPYFLTAQDVDPDFITIEDPLYEVYSSDLTITNYNVLCTTKFKLKDNLTYPVALRFNAIADNITITVEDTKTEDTYFFSTTSEKIKSGEIATLFFETSTEGGYVWNYSKVYEYEQLENKTQTIDQNSTADQYPSAKAVFDTLDSFQPVLSLDTQMSDTSENGVQNKVIKNYIDSRNCVTTDTDQTITGNKTFDDNIKFISSDETYTGAYSNISSSPTGLSLLLRHTDAEGVVDNTLILQDGKTIFKDDSGEIANVVRSPAISSTSINLITGKALNTKLGSYVTKSGNVTISGTKTFSSTVVVDSGTTATTYNGYNLKKGSQTYASLIPTGSSGGFLLQSYDTTNKLPINRIYGSGNTTEYNFQKKDGSDWISYANIVVDPVISDTSVDLINGKTLNEALKPKCQLLTEDDDLNDCLDFNTFYSFDNDFPDNTPKDSDECSLPKGTVWNIKNLTYVAEEEEVYTVVQFCEIDDVQLYVRLGYGGGERFEEWTKVYTSSDGDVINGSDQEFNWGTKTFNKLKQTSSGSINSTSFDVVNGKDIYNYCNKYAKTEDLANVATSGNYNDLSGKPTIPDTSLLAVDANVMHKTGDESCSGAKSFSSGGITIIGKNEYNRDIAIGKLSTECFEDIPIVGLKAPKGQMTEIPTRGAVSNLVRNYQPSSSEYTLSEDETTYTTPTRDSLGTVIYNTKNFASTVTHLTLSEYDQYSNKVYGKTIVSNVNRSTPITVNNIVSNRKLSEVKFGQDESGMAIVRYDRSCINPSNGDYILVDFAFREDHSGRVKVYKTDVTGSGTGTASTSTSEFTDIEARKIYRARLEDSSTFDCIKFYVGDIGNYATKDMLLFVRITARVNGLLIAPFDYAEFVVAYGVMSSNYSTDWGIKYYD